MKTGISIIIGLVLGIGISWYLLFFSPQTAVNIKKFFFPTKQIFTTPQKEIIGFLPYWLVAKAKGNYATTITTLTYFGLTIGIDGHMQYMANDTEEEPGWHMLKSDTMQKKLQEARKQNMTLSLLAFSGDADAIDTLISDPKTHARNLTSDIFPLMKKYGFSDLNLDIESTKLASDQARENFLSFLEEVHTQVKKQSDMTLTIEITGNDLIRKNVISPKDIAQFSDYVVIMAYDFHYAGSLVSGPVAPIGGAESYAEFDTNTVLAQAYKAIPREKIVLGIPSYGYSWETLESIPFVATLPQSGITMSSATAENLLAACSSCSAMFDEKAKENFITYKDDQTGTTHQVYYPNAQAVAEKVSLATKNNLAGLAIWALGYESEGLYTPIARYKNDIVDITRL